MKKVLHKIALILLIILTGALQQVVAQGGRVDIGKSIANLTKMSGGGAFGPGDTIEIRVTLAVLTKSTPTIIDNVQVFDVIPNKTTYIPGSMRVATNEGVTYKGNFTDAADGDAGTKSGNNIMINLGKGATRLVGGRIKSDSSRPSFYNSTCIMMACYRVRINPSANYGDTISIGGHLKYRPVQPGGAVVDSYFDPIDILVYSDNQLCNNGRALSSASDYGGTFGDGITQNRPTALAFTTTYQKVNNGTNTPNDYYYSIVNNSSADGSTNPNIPIPNSKRVFTVWDIGGDHTDATIPANGNLPTAPGSRGGYFVLVNASYNTDIAYQETLTNLCPNTYYEFTAWFRNVCARCGCDSTGRGAGSSGYKPGAGNDSSGVKPNLTFEIDDLAYYTTGDIKYSRTHPWRKFGFSFITGPTQSSAKFTIRNNSPGGGGNDWALDDINISHCGPDLSMNYNPIVLGCSSAPFVVKLADTIRYAYPNSYIYYKWQKSDVGGNVWTDIPGATGSGTTTYVNGAYQFITTLPAFLATPADSGTYYRVIVATTNANLYNNCAYNDQSSTMVKVIDCGVVLNSGFEQFRGRLIGRNAQLSWRVSNEENLAWYDIERSSDGYRFEKIARIASRNSVNADYLYTDPVEVNGNLYYRIRMIDIDGRFTYSSVVVVGNDPKLEIKNLNNPFDNYIIADIVIPSDGMLTLRLYNDKGQITTTKTIKVQKGIQTITLDNIICPTGFYVLSADLNQKSVKRKLIKINR